MAVNIGPKIGIDGEKEYRKQINDLITQQKTFSAEMRELESSFDENTSAMEKNRKKGELLEKQIKNQEKQVEELEKGLKASKEKYGENATETQKWKQAVANAKTELNKMRSELNKLPSSLSSAGKAMQSVGKKMKTVGAAMTKYVSAPVAALGAASIAAFKEVDAGMDAVAKKTGATGEALTDLQNSAKSIATTIPTSFETAGDAVGAVNTKFGLTGTELENLTSKFIKFADINDTDVSTSVENVQKVMAAFGMDTEDAGTLLDALNKTGQKTGISMDTLEGSLVKNAASLKDMGLDAYSAASFLGQVETSGANTETVMAGLSKALLNANEEGKTLPQALSDFQSVMNSSASEQEKLNAAIELFGKKAGPAIYEACNSGSLSFQTLSEDASTYMGSVEQTFEDVKDPADDFQVALNNLKDAGAELGGSLLDIATPAIEAITGAAKTAKEWIENMTDEQREMVGYITVALAVGGPALTAIGNLVGAIGTVTSAAGTAIAKVTELGAMKGALAALASPAGIAMAALVALTAAMVVARSEGIKENEELQEMLSATAEATDELTEATESLKGTISDAEDNLEGINSKADLADDLINELYELEEQSNKTAAEQGRMMVIVDELNELYPGLSLEIDKTTGSLNKGKAEVKGYVTEAKKLALIEAYTSASKSTMEKLATASVALKKAQAQQKEGQDYLTSAQEKYNEALEKAPKDYKGQVIQTKDTMAAANAVYLAAESLDKLNTAVEDGEKAVADAEDEYQLYIDAAEELSGSLDDASKTQEEQAQATEKTTEAVKEQSNALSENARILAEDIAAAISNIGKQSQAWAELYDATKESIEGQIGLFDEWKEEQDLTAEDIIKNLESQKKGMTGYTSNMKRLSAEAVKSSDPNFKKLVKSIADMGVDGASYAKLLVKTLDDDKEQFNQILSLFGENHGEISDGLAEELTYIESDFTTKAGAAVGDVISLFSQIGNSKAWTNLKSYATTTFQTMKQKITETESQAKTSGDNIGNSLKMSFTNGMKTLPQTAAAQSSIAIKDTTTSINGMNLSPSVKSIGVPKKVTDDAKETISKNASGAGVDIKISNAASVAQSLRDTIQNYFTNNPLSTTIKGIVQKVMGHAQGGFVYQEQLSWLAEGNKPEVVIPLASSDRANALSLYRQTGQILGVASSAAKTPTYNLPGNIINASTSGPSLNTQELYAAVAAGAARGIASADLKIYWDSREAGRIMRNMGVQFV